ncbi:hypothetical protein CK203_106573 [Vitis vinifera]|uniref:Uncharacterized protein n=1 Tax=Vitis vinifera TaxID=29760 RepID=A0A438CG70_VITVI|nr:hypothetical protein CK203_106573 [Vitis vinifera]
MVMAGRATCIVFSNDDLPPDGPDHTRPLYISIGCLGRRVPSVVLDNGSALNVCPLATTITLSYAPTDFGFEDSYILLTCFWVDLGFYRTGAIPSSLHQKVKFIHDGRVIIVQSVGDMFISSEPVLQISHSDDDLFLTGFTFDKVQTLEMEDFCRDFVHEPSEFRTIPNHDVHSDSGTSTSALAAPSSPDRMSLITLYFPYEIDEQGTFAKIGGIVDGVVPHD